MKQAKSKNKFFVYGLVHPLEYDWKSQFQDIRRLQEKDPSPYKALDVGKVLGLAAYVEELEEIAQKAQEVVWNMCVDDDEPKIAYTLVKYFKSLKKAVLPWVETKKLFKRGEDEREEN